VIGDPEIFAQTSRQLGLDLDFNPIDALPDAVFTAGKLDVLQPDDLSLPSFKIGEVDPVCGKAVAVCLRCAWHMAMEGKVHGIAAGPMHKRAFHLAGYDYLDELGFFMDVTGNRNAFFMGVMGKVWTVAVAEHVAFADILALVKRERILYYTKQMHSALSRILDYEPKLAVVGLNPHSGEGGLLGKEEINEIIPAIKQAQSIGINVEGPIPADMVFVLALRGQYDGVVCMYHDHANTARKLQPTTSSATLYMGLPVIGATTAHGTAFDIAGKGVADPGSMTAALSYAISLAQPPDNLDLC
jgi:4-hydroxythreonine-4-phosphate dehydrogenase